MKPCVVCQEDTERMMNPQCIISGGVVFCLPCAAKLDRAGKFEACRDAILANRQKKRQQKMEGEF